MLISSGDNMLLVMQACVLIWLSCLCLFGSAFFSQVKRTMGVHIILYIITDGRLLMFLIGSKLLLD